MKVKSTSQKSYNTKNGTLIDINKKALEEVLTQVVQTMVDKTNQKINEDKIITEYIEDSVENSEDFKEELKNNIEKIKLGTNNNNILIISEVEGKIYLPYTIDEVEEYLKCYPADYKTAKDVVEKEFIVDYEKFFKKPEKAKFIETYALIRNREGKNIIYALFYAFKMMFYKNINAAIIAACKKEIELNNYLYFLQNKNTDSFEYFKIIYDSFPKSKN